MHSMFFMIPTSFSVFITNVKTNHYNIKVNTSAEISVINQK
jgi:hypothetical protein